MANEMPQIAILQGKLLRHPIECFRNIAVHMKLGHEELLENALDHLDNVPDLESVRDKLVAFQTQWHKFGQSSNTILKDDRKQLVTNIIQCLVDTAFNAVHGVGYFDQFSANLVQSIRLIDELC